MSSTPCYHCGEPCDSPPLVTEHTPEPLPVCCPGCQSVVDSIHQLGLDQYYRFRDKPAARPESRDAILETLTLFDEPENQGDTRQLSSGNETILTIHGMNCAACCWLLENSLNALPGVTQCSVNLATHSARIDWNPEAIRLSEILFAIHQLGYEAFPRERENQQKAFDAENRKFLFRLALSGLGSMQVMMYAVGLYTGMLEGMETEYRDFLRGTSLIITLPVLWFAGKPFLAGAWSAFMQKKVTMDTPVSLALLIAFFASLYNTFTGQHEVYYDSVCMFIFFLTLSRYLEFRSRVNAWQSNALLSSARIHTCLQVDETGQTHTQPLNAIQPGQHLLVKPGEVIPLDGLLAQHLAVASSELVYTDESLLTGESHPVRKNLGDTVYAGTLLLDQPAVIEVITDSSNTRLSRIRALIDNAQYQKNSDHFLTERIARVFIPVILLLSVLTAIGWWLVDPEKALPATLAVLVASCPCALSLATPVALTTAINRLANSGFLTLDTSLFDRIHTIQQLAMDKTGTLTQGKPAITTQVTSPGMTEQQVQAIAAALEQHSNHPVAHAFLAAHKALPPPATEARIHPNAGVEGLVEGQRFCIGKPELARTFLEQQGHSRDFITQLQQLSAGNHTPDVLLASETGLIAGFYLEDPLREGAGALVEFARQSHWQTWLVSGDRPERVEAIAHQLRIDHFRASLSPEQKLAFIQELQMRKPVMMIGDGLNDAPVLAQADIGIAMGSGPDLTRLSADGVLLSEKLSTLQASITTLFKTRRIVTQNITWAILYNLGAMPLAAAGYLPPWAAALGMSASSLLVTLNALRLRQADL